MKNLPALAALLQSAAEACSPPPLSSGKVLGASTATELAGQDSATAAAPALFAVHPHATK